MKAVRTWIKENRYGVFFFAVLLVRMLLRMPYRPSQLGDTWTTVFYLTDYRTVGIVPRALIGSICALFFQKITATHVYVIALVMTLVCILAASILVNRVFRRLTAGRTALFVTVCTFLLLHSALYYYFDPEHFGITDLYFLLLTLLAVCLAEHKALRWLIPLLCVCAMAIYEGYAFAFMPTVGIVLLHVCLKEKRFGAWAVLILSCAGVAATFVFLYVLFRADYWNTLRYPTVEALNAALQKRTDLPIPDMLSEVYYYTSSLTMFTDGRWDVAVVLRDTRTIRRECLPSVAVFLGVTLPVWVRSFRTENEKRLRAVWLLCLLAPLAAVPFLAFSEQMKYFSYMIVSQLILLLFFSVREPAVQDTLGRAEQKLTAHPLLVCIPWGLLLFFRTIW